MVPVQRTSAEDLELAQRSIAGNGDAFGVLFERWFDRAFDVAWHIVHDRETAADVTQEAFASAWQQIGSLRQPESFGGWLLRIARNKALNRLQREQRSRPVGDEETLVMLDTRRSDDATDGVTRAEHGDLVWAASAALGEDDASVLSLHLRHGLEAPELAEELGVKPNAAHQRLFRLKKRLADAIGAWVLWRRGQPSCSVLQTILDDAGITRFDATTARTIGAHARDCSACDTSRELRLSPEALFGAMPLVVAEPALRARVVAALKDMGVPARAVNPADRPDQPAEPGDTALTEADTPTGDAPTAAREDTTETEVAGERPSDAESATEPGASPARGRLVATGVAVIVALAIGGGIALSMFTGGSSAPDLETERVEAGAELSEPEMTAPPATIGVPDISDAPATDDVTDGDLARGDDAGSAPAPTGSDVLAEPTGPDPGTATPPTEASPPPVIGGFRAQQGDHACGSTEIPITFAWSSTDATSATLGRQGGAPKSVETSGTAAECAVPGTTWVLTVTGPGGSDSAETVVR
jgi:RNA polymerase sigma factor (sigma-70 family)